MEQKERILMDFTEAQLDAILPRHSASMSESDYFELLKFDNEGINFGSVINCDADELSRARAFIQQKMAPQPNA